MNDFEKSASYRWMERIEDALLRIERKVDDLMSSVDRIRSAVEAETTQVASISALVSGLADQIRANAADETALNELADQLDAQNAALGAAVAANTPAPAPTPASDPSSGTTTSSQPPVSDPAQPSVTDPTTDPSTDGPSTP